MKSIDDWLQAVALGETQLGFQEWQRQGTAPDSAPSFDNDVQGPLRLGIECVENGRSDEALLHLNMALTRYMRSQNHD